MADLYETPFTVLVDSNESHPFAFNGIRGDASEGARPLLVKTRFECLGRYPDSLGDYGVAGLVGSVGVERKSMEDAWGTVLGWETPSEREKELAGRRQRLEKELENLAKIPFGCVVVEAPFHACLEQMPSWGTKPAGTNAKIFNRSVLAYTQDYRVPWVFCGTRRHAERFTLRYLWRAWRKLR